VRHYKVNIPVAAQHPASALPSSPLMTTVAVFTRRASSFFASPIRRAIYFGHPAVPRRGGGCNFRRRRRRRRHGDSAVLQYRRCSAFITAAIERARHLTRGRAEGLPCEGKHDLPGRFKAACPHKHPFATAPQDSETRRFSQAAFRSALRSAYKKCTGNTGSLPCEFGGRPPEAAEGEHPIRALGF